MRANRALGPEPKGTDAVDTIETGCPELSARFDAGVAVLTLDRAEARNALTIDMKHALWRLLPELAADPAVRCVALTGAGKAFCAGGDTKRMQQEGRPPSLEERRRQLEWEHDIPRWLHTMSTPTIAVLPGAAAGAGFGLALSCDLRIAAERAFVTTSYARLGLSGDYGCSWFLTQLVGTSRARDLFFTARRVESAECARLGIFNRVVPDAELETEAMALAHQIAEGPPIAHRYMKENLLRAAQVDLDTALRFEADRMVRGAQTDDYREAVVAFNEKRKPVFEGH